MSELSKRVDRWMLRDIERSKTMDTELEYHLINDLHNALQAAIKQDKQEPHLERIECDGVGDNDGYFEICGANDGMRHMERCDTEGGETDCDTRPAPMRWRKVEDGLPKERIRVNAWDGLIVADCFLDSDGGWKDSEGQPVQFPITHWMPLPEPPAELKGG